MGVAVGGACVAGEVLVAAVEEALDGSLLPVSMGTSPPLAPAAVPLVGAVVVGGALLPTPMAVGMSAYT